LVYLKKQKVENKTADDFGPIGALSISEDVIITCVKEAVTATKGVYDLYGGLQDALSQNILGKESRSKGVRIFEEEDGIVVDVQIIVEYGVKIPEIAWNLQRNVKSGLERATDAVVHAVNVSVQGVRVADSKKRTKEKVVGNLTDGRSTDNLKKRKDQVNEQE
jgi:uncharacterized alkaline shock family protein YloU